MINIYGTIGPACADLEILKQMFQEGMTGLRLNTSHISLKEAEPQIELIHNAAAACGIRAKLLIDMQGPELRVGKLSNPINLETDSSIVIATSGFDGEVEGNDSFNVCQSPVIPVPDVVSAALKSGMQLLLDDGKLLLQMTSHNEAKILRGGLLRGGKSIAVKGAVINVPAMTDQDQQNIKDAVHYGVTGVMQPFVRDAQDLHEVRRALSKAGARHISLLAKIENLSGVANLESFFDLADEIVIARGDLGNAVPLWELPALQKDIERRCLDANVPFMVVTQMLASMEHSAVPTRAEVSDIYNAVCDGASSVMVTGETAVGEYPVEVIKYLARTVRSYYT